MSSFLEKHIVKHGYIIVGVRGTVRNKSNVE